MHTKCSLKTQNARRKSTNPHYDRKVLGHKQLVGNEVLWRSPASNKNKIEVSGLMRKGMGHTAVSATSAF